MNDCVQAEMGSASLSSPMRRPRRASDFLHGLVMGVACLIAVAGSALASDLPPTDSLPDFSYDVQLAPGVPPPAARGSIQNETRAWQADFVRVYKAERRLVLFANHVPIDEFQIALGSRPIGPKRQKGDGRTPEGIYTIDWRKADSDFFRALHISYPNQRDRRAARERGVSPGGAIMIHGLPNGLGMIGAHHILRDWTDGCIAVTNEEMALLWERVPDGVTIEIFP